MTVRWLTAFIDRPAATFDAATRFWSDVTAATSSPPRGDHGEFATLIPGDGDAFLRVQRVVDGPGGAHLDVHVDDIPATARRAVELGATALTTHDDVVVLRSPAGLPFCVVRHAGESRRPPPVTPPASSVRTLVDQLCIDTPPDDHGGECVFWSALTEWEQRPTSRPEFTSLQRARAMPLRLLLQRLDRVEDDPQATAHLDLACDDVEAAAADHERLGARVQGRHEQWITLTDPSGVRYCLTRRDPDTGRHDRPS